MKKKLTLRKYITIYLTVLIAILVIIYGVLLDKFLIAGLDESASMDLFMTSKIYASQYQKNPDTPFPSSPNLKTYLSTKDLPFWVTEQFSPKTYESKKMLLGEIPYPGQDLSELDMDGGGAGFFLLYPYTLPDGKQIFLLKTFEEKFWDKDNNYTKYRFMFFDYFPWFFGVVMLVFMIAISVFSLRKVARPVEKLTQWAANLSPKEIQQSHPDFKFPEINQLADQLQDSMKQLNAAVEHEHRFLRNASHELRTPIAVTLSNLDLLKKIRPDRNPKEDKVYQRLRRAADNMKEITETLLLLSRKKEKLPDLEPVRLDKVVSNLISENQYLLKGKEVSIKVCGDSNEEKLPSVACHMVLRNLIRNAFQYTVEGEVCIRIQTKTIKIRNINYNQQNNIQPHGQDYGYGLGLELVKQIAERYKWTYHNQAISGGHIATISFLIIEESENSGDARTS